MTPGEIRELRRIARFIAGDHYATAGLASIVHKDAISEALSQEAAEIGGLLDACSEFEAHCGYAWAREPDSFDMPVEAAFQRRMLFMAGAWWTAAADRGSVSERLSHVVVVQELITQFGLCSPRVRSLRGAKVLSIPAGFVEMILWSFTALRCWTAIEQRAAAGAAEDDAWQLVTRAVPKRPAQPFRHVCAFELIARTLAQEGRDRALEGENAALLIREQLPSLAGETGELDPDSLRAFERDATYLCVEFALAHELGHVIADHRPAAGAFDASQEVEADRRAIALVDLTAPTRVFGWGADLLAPGVQAAICLALFAMGIETQTTLVSGLLRRFMARDDAARLLREEQLRAALAFRALEQLVNRLAARGDDRIAAGRIATLADNFHAMARDLRTTIAQVPDDEVRQALAIAARAGLGGAASDQ